MSDALAQFERTHGARLPRVEGELEIEGLERPIHIGRDAYGIPLISAETENDAFYALGFCQGQDRSFQLEQQKRAVHGRLAEWVGALALPIDRLMRRIGFVRSARAQEQAFQGEDQALVEAFVRGVNDGVNRGLDQPAHELSILGVEPSRFEALDVLALTKLAAMLLSSNWEVELARLRILQQDGLQALLDLDPVDPEWLPVTDPPATPAGRAAERLAEDAAALARHLGLGGGSNNWVVAGARTASGRPLLANDPHLPPMLPAPWYLVRLETPEFAVAGAAFVGVPFIGVGHNGTAAWGVTAAMIDTSDLFLEEIGPDGRSVRQGDGFVACEVVREEIAVRGAEPVVEEILVTPRGPIIGPALGGEPQAIALRASWLSTEPYRLPRLHRVRSFAELREQFACYNGPPTNYVYADAHGEIGWQLTGRAPRRRRGFGTLPAPGWEPEHGWESEPVAFAEMPHAKSPACGFLATANNRPRVDGDGPFLGVDFVDGYRVARIVEVLGSREDWDAEGMAALQHDTLSLPWRELGGIVLAGDEGDEDSRTARRLLADWDGRVADDSPAASVFELFLAEMTRRLAEARAPRSAAWALGQGPSPLAPVTVLMFRRIGHLVRLLREQPRGWLKRSFAEEIADALGAAVRTLREQNGPDPAGWAWGRVRPLTFAHPLGILPGLAPVLNLGPLAWGGDMNTVAQAGTNLLEPTANPLFVASLRAVIDVGAWDEARFVLAGGQSGNPVSPHYRDQLPLWARGETISIPWSPDAVRAATRSSLRLRPPA